MLNIPYSSYIFNLQAFFHPFHVCPHDFLRSLSTVGNFLEIIRYLMIYISLKNLD